MARGGRENGAQRRNPYPTSTLSASTAPEPYPECQQDIEHVRITLLIHMHPIPWSGMLENSLDRCVCRPMSKVASFLHQNTTLSITYRVGESCNSPCFYIKPQQGGYKHERRTVVIHLVATSNHNISPNTVVIRLVVIHLVATSNHNNAHWSNRGNLVVIHLVATSNHNRGISTMPLPQL